MRDLPAILGGPPVFERRRDIVRPTLPPMDTVRERLAEVLSTGRVTNDSRYVREFEERLRHYVGAKYCVAVANATLGLMLAVQAVEGWGEVLIPSFTFVATALAVTWNGRKVAFADIRDDTFTIDPDDVRRRITERTSAIIGVHVYGNPCEVEALERVAKETGVRLVYDSAHAFGSRYGDRRLGTFGDVEVFSFHATKIFPVGEGGVVVTNNEAIYERVRRNRNFGLGHGGDCVDYGLNAKMTEFAAILGLEALTRVGEWIERRREVAATLRARLGKLRGVRFQRETPRSTTNAQNFCLVVVEEEAGLSRDHLAVALEAENIVSRKYFYPPLHQCRAYRDRAPRRGLPTTEWTAQRVLCLPQYSDMGEDEVDGLCAAVERIFHHAAEVAGKVGACHGS
jgi:dTDP-4-amino-4,6-dideoxygalactose transaminase